MASAAAGGALVGAGGALGLGGSILGLNSARRDAKQQQKLAKQMLAFLKGEYFGNKQAGLKVLGDTAERSRVELGKLTNQENLDTQTAYSELGSNVQQDVVNRGLGGTTVGTVMKAGVARDRAAALNRLIDQQAMRRIASDQQNSGNIASFLSSLNPSSANAGYGARLGAPSAPSLAATVGNWGTGFGGALTNIGGSMLTES